MSTQNDLETAVTVGVDSLRDRGDHRAEDAQQAWELMKLKAAAWDWLVRNVRDPAWPIWSLERVNGDWDLDRVKKISPPISLDGPYEGEDLLEIVTRIMG